MFFVSIFLLIAILLILSGIFIATWVYRDAKSRGLNGGLWAIVIIISGVFLGLLLYFLVGREKEQIICKKCGAYTSPDIFCLKCGQYINEEDVAVKKDKGLIIASIACIVLSVIFFIIIFISTIRLEGFSLGYSYASSQYGYNSSVHKLYEKSSGDTWELSFSEASNSYVFSQKYKSTKEPTVLTIDATMDSGSVVVVVIQDDMSIYQDIGRGHYDIDLSQFDTGEIYIDIINIDATNFSGKSVIN